MKSVVNPYLKNTEPKCQRTGEKAQVYGFSRSTATAPVMTGRTINRLNHETWRKREKQENELFIPLGRRGNDGVEKTRGSLM